MRGEDKTKGRGKGKGRKRRRIKRERRDKWDGRREEECFEVESG